MRHCGKCGHDNDASESFCSGCGEFLGWDDDPRPSSSPTPPPPAPPARPSAVPSSRAAALLANPVVRQAQEEAEAAELEAQRVRAEAEARARAETETAKRRATDEAREARNAANARAEDVVDEATRTATGSRAEVAAMVAQIRQEAESKAHAEVTDAELRAARRARRAREEAHVRAQAEAAEADRKAKEAGQRAAALLARLPAKPAEPARQAAPAQPIQAGAPVVPVLPAAPIQRRPPPAKEAAPPQPAQPGDLTCGHCGTASESARRFCRKCGTSLVPAAPVAARPGRFWRLRAWLRSIIGRRSTEQGAEPTGRSAASTNSGPGLSFSNIWRGALAVVAVVGLAAAVGPYRKQARADVTRARRHVLPKPSYIDGEVASGGPQEACTKCLTDKVLAPKEFMSTEIATNPPTPGSPPAFTVALGSDGNLTKPVNVFKVGIVAGVLGEQPAKHPGVHHLLLVAHGKDGAQLKSKTVTLRDDTSFQSFSFAVPRVLRVDFYVLDTYSSSDRQGPYAVDEVEFFALT